jgi:hypothetical protein
MPDLARVVHRDCGPSSTFLTLREAERELADVLYDEPTWVGDVWVEPFTVEVLVGGAD